MLQNYAAAIDDNFESGNETYVLDFVLEYLEIQKNFLLR